MLMNVIAHNITYVMFGINHQHHENMSCVMIFDLNLYFQGH